MSVNFIRRAIAKAAIAGGGRWWRSVGTPVGAWQFKWVADYEMSKINLASPGLFDAVPGNPNPVTFDSDRGWIVKANNYTPATIGNTKTPAVTSTWSYFISFSNGTQSGARCLGGRSGFKLWRRTANNALWLNGGHLSGSSNYDSGVMGISGSTAYVNGFAVNTIPSGSAPFSLFAIGTDYSGGGNNAGCDLWAAILFDFTLSPEQVATLTAAMTAL